MSEPATAIAEKTTETVTEIASAVAAPVATIVETAAKTVTETVDAVGHATASQVLPPKAASKWKFAAGILIIGAGIYFLRRMKKKTTTTETKPARTLGGAEYFGR